MISEFVPQDYQKVKIARVALADAETAGGIAAVVNPLGVAAIITKVIVNVTTVATGACTVNVGVAADGTTASDTLIDGIDVNTAVGIFNNVDDAGTNGKAVATWSASQYVTVSKATGDAADVEGFIYIFCIPA